MRSVRISAAAVTSLMVAGVMSQSGASAMANSEVTALNHVRGNTLVIVNSFGPTFLYFEPTGKVRATGWDKNEAAGTWRVDGDKVCVTKTLLAAGAVAAEHCIDVKVRNFTDRWEVRDPTAGRLLYKWFKGPPPKTFDRLSLDDTEVSLKRHS